MIERYGNPPAELECRRGSPPENLVLKTHQVMMLAGATDMHSAIGMPASPVAIARQLNVAYDFGKAGPVVVEVPGYGKFLLGQEGWCLVR